MKRKLFVGILGFLTIVNLSALGTMLYNKITVAEEHTATKQAILSADSTEKCTEAECPMATELGLTAEQMDQMRSRQMSINRNILGLSREVGEWRTQLIEELRTPKPDTGRINQILTAVDSLQSRIQQTTVQNLLEVKKVLNPEQQELLFYQILKECKYGMNRTFPSQHTTSPHKKGSN